MYRRVDFYTDPEEPGCDEIKEFLRSLDLDLRIRDLSVNPLKYEELDRLIRHIDLKHFINAGSKAYKKFHLDKGLPSRKEVIELFASDNELLRKPIVVAGRLMTIGPNRLKIMEMLQIKNNGSDPSEGNRANNNKESKESKDSK
jgi:arsenate reductase-like glutaredoxin family protein